MTMLAGWMLGSCSMMEDDQSDCPTGLYVSFKYDYNLQRADMFKDHVGSVTVYVFDEQGRFVTKQTEENKYGEEPLKKYGYQMNIKNLPDGKYQLMAFAQQKPYADTSAEGANFVIAEPLKGDGMEALHARLDRTSLRSEGPTSKVDNQGLSLDTLWNGFNTHFVEVKSTRPSYDTISLVRDTKMLTVSLRHLDDDKKADISTNDFEVFIVDNNGWINHDNSLREDEDLLYTPFHVWETDFKDDNGEVVERTAHFGLMFSRLMYYAEAEKNALLVIRNKETKEEVAVINLSDCLAQGRNAVDYMRYSKQEFLDREYNYSLDFFLQGNHWKYVDLRISILSWSKRIQNVEL